MNIVKWTPFRELEDMQTRLNRFFGDAPMRTFEADAPFFADWAPPVDVEETDKEYLIKAELPDIAKENVKVEMLDGVLTIEGERKREKEEKDKKFLKVERLYGKFVRQFALPAEVEAAKIQAEFKDGVLNVHLPKTAAAKPTAIDVMVHCGDSGGPRPGAAPPFLYGRQCCLPEALVEGTVRRRYRPGPRDLGPASRAGRERRRSPPFAQRDDRAPRRRRARLQNHRESPLPRLLGER
jgi:HSP20 family protein